MASRLRNLAAKLRGTAAFKSPSRIRESFAKHIEIQPGTTLWVRYLGANTWDVRITSSAKPMLAFTLGRDELSALVELGNYILGEKGLEP